MIDLTGYLLAILLSALTTRAGLDVCAARYVIVMTPPDSREAVEIVGCALGDGTPRRLPYATQRFPGDPLLPLPILLNEDDACRAITWRGRLIAVIPDASSSGAQRAYYEGLTRWATRRPPRAAWGIALTEGEAVRASAAHQMPLADFIARFGPPHSQNVSGNGLTLRYYFVDTVDTGTDQTGKSYRLFRGLEVSVDSNRVSSVADVEERIRSADLASR